MLNISTIDPSRSQTTERRPESGSFGRKIEFSSSFEKFKSVSSSNSSHNINRPTSFLAADMVRRGSRTSDHSSINLVSFFVFLFLIIDSIFTFFS